MSTQKHGINVQYLYDNPLSFLPEGQMNWLILLELVSVARAILDINSFLPSVNKIRIVFLQHS